MSKDLDPLRELESELDREAPLPPTVHFSRAQNTSTSQVREPEYKKQLPVAVSSQKNSLIPYTGESRSSPSSSLSVSTMRMRVGALPNVGITENLSTKIQISPYRSLRPTLGLFTLGLLLSFVFVGVLSVLNRPVRRDSQSTAPSTTGSSFIEPLFGLYAKNMCQARCVRKSASIVESCKRGCNIYALDVYGRRVAFDDYDPKSDAATILSRCTKRSVELQIVNDPNAGATELGLALELSQRLPRLITSQSLKTLKDTYREVLSTNQQLLSTPIGSTYERLAEQLVRATCLQANLTLTAIAVNTVRVAKDNYSENYYQGIFTELQQRTQPINDAALREGKTLLEDTKP